MLLHEHASRRPAAGSGSGASSAAASGTVTEAMADAAREAGAEIRTDAPVERILVDGGRAAGVALADGAGDRAPHGCSRTPTRSAPSSGLVGRGAAADGVRGRLGAYRCEGTSMKINLAVDRAADVAGVDGDAACSRTTAGSWS